MNNECEGLTESAEKELSLDDWKSGVEEYQELTLADVWAALGFGETQALASFNQFEDPAGAVFSDQQTAWTALEKKGGLIPLRPRWHQIVGMLKIMEHVIKGKPLLIMDHVGVGKTIQLIGACTLYSVFYRYFCEHQTFPGKFGKKLLEYLVDAQLAD